MSRTGPRKYYDQEFKMNAVRLAIERERPLAEIARDLGINENMLWRWKKEFSKDPEQAFPGKGHLTDKDEEIRQLRKDLADVKEERDILKKVVSIFSKPPK
jgi:transposase